MDASFSGSRPGPLAAPPLGAFAAVLLLLAAAGAWALLHPRVAPADVAGCWELASPGRSALLYPHLAEGGTELVVLDTVPLPKGRRWTPERAFLIRPLGAPPSMADWPAVYWTRGSASTIRVVATDGFFGLELRLRVRGDRLEGTARAFDDLRGSVPYPEWQVRGWRIACTLMGA